MRQSSSSISINKLAPQRHETAFSVVSLINKFYFCSAFRINIWLSLRPTGSLICFCFYETCLFRYCRVSLCPSQQINSKSFLNFYNWRAASMSLRAKMKPIFKTICASVLLSANTSALCTGQMLSKTSYISIFPNLLFCVKMYFCECTYTQIAIGLHAGKP